MLRLVSGVAGCWLYRGMTSLEPPTELCTGALTSAPHTCPTLPPAPQTYRQPIFKPFQAPCCAAFPLQDPALSPIEKLTLDRSHCVLEFVCRQKMKLWRIEMQPSMFTIQLQPGGWERFQGTPPHCLQH